MKESALNTNVYENSILANNYVIKTNKAGKITFVNSNYLNLTGFCAEDILDSCFNNFVISDNDGDILDELSSHQYWKGIIKSFSKDGTPLYMDIQINPVYDKKGRISEILAFGSDVSEYINIKKYDKLTGLKNRDALAGEIIDNTLYSIAIVNLDNFSEINEFYGGYIGDQVIRKASKRLVSVFSKHHVFRLQGDEFAILNRLPEDYNQEMVVESIKNRVKSIFEASLELDDIDLPITATVGMYIGREKLLRNANIAYKNSKQKNINFSLFSDEMFYKFADFSHNKKVANDIKEAIKDDLVTPYYQAIVDNKTKKVVKYEALARLVKEDSVLMPSSFLDISKKIKYYNKITRTMIYKSMKDFSQLPHLQLSINISLEDIANTRTFAFIIEQLQQNKNNEFITFEIVESEGIEDFALFDKFVSVIKKFGAKISIDDFGTGYSNFSYLTKLEPDFLKIDGSLIKNIENQKDFDVVKTIVGFAKMYNIKTIAEYVENEDIFVLIQELGIDYSQGYHFGKPITFKEIESI